MLKKLKDSLKSVLSKNNRVIEHIKKPQRKFWVEIQHMEPFDEKDNPNEAIFIQRRREDLDNVGEVFEVIENI